MREVKRGCNMEESKGEMGHQEEMVRRKPRGDGVEESQEGKEGIGRT